MTTLFVHTGVVGWGGDGGWCVWSTVGPFKIYHLTAMYHISCTPIWYYLFTTICPSDIQHRITHLLHSYHLQIPLRLSSNQRFINTGTVSFRHDTMFPRRMMTSSNGNIFRVTGHLYGNSTIPGEFPTQRPVTWSFGVFFDLRLNKRLSKRWRCWWFETPSRPLWRHRNGLWWRCSSNTYIIVHMHHRNLTSLNSSQ